MCSRSSRGITRKSATTIPLSRGVSASLCLLVVVASPWPKVATSFTPVWLFLRACSTAVCLELHQWHRNVADRASREQHHRGVRCRQPSCPTWWALSVQVRCPSYWASIFSPTCSPSLWPTGRMMVLPSRSASPKLTQDITQTLRRREALQQSRRHGQHASRDDRRHGDAYLSARQHDPTGVMAESSGSRTPKP